MWWILVNVRKHNQRYSVINITRCDVILLKRHGKVWIRINVKYKSVINLGITILSMLMKTNKINFSRFVKRLAQKQLERYHPLKNTSGYFSPLDRAGWSVRADRQAKKRSVNMGVTIHDTDTDDCHRSAAETLQWCHHLPFLVLEVYHFLILAVHQI